MRPTLAISLLILIVSCSGQGSPSSSGTSEKKVLATTAVLGTLVSEILGREVRSLIPPGVDLHQWQPSAQDMAAVQQADVVIENGLHLEESLEKLLDQRRKAGKKILTAANYIEVRKSADSEVHDPGENHEDEHGPEDPHFWTSPKQMKLAAAGLGKDLQEIFGPEIYPRWEGVVLKLADLDQRVQGQAGALKPSQKRLVTGHESLGYLARDYGLELLGAVIPGLSTQGEVSAGELSRLKDRVQKTGVRAVFTEQGTPQSVAEALARETGAVLVPLNTHGQPGDTYLTLLEHLTSQILKTLETRP